jgi:hypothetical protein
VTPVLQSNPTALEPFVADFTSGYFARAMESLPKQGKEFPWKLFQNYIKDVKLLRKGTLVDGVLAFTRAHAEVETEPLLQAAE